MSNNEFVRMENICKEFPGVKALQHVNLTVRCGEIHALVGENGAGKSTLIKILMGVHQKTSGEIYLNGEKVNILNPMDAKKMGLGAVYQDVTISTHLSVAENFFLGNLPKTKLGFVDWKYIFATAQKALDDLNIKVNAHEIVKNLSVAQQEMVVIGKKYFENSKLMIFDEPTAMLANEEVEELFKIIKDLKARGTAIIYISHRLEEIFRICDRITVLKDGQTVKTMNVEDIDEEKLVGLMVGRSVSDMYNIKSYATNEPILEVKNLTHNGVYKNINFTLNKGEILGFFGLVNSGRTEIMRGIFGADPIDSGEIWLNGKDVTISKPKDAIKLGIGLLPEDRKNQGLTLATSIKHNINLASYKNISKCSFINHNKENMNANKQVKDMAIKTPGIYQKVVNLSGGNQQKVVIGKWLCCESDVLIFDEPTVGIDVGAKSEIYQMMEQLVAKGKSIIMISSYLPEVMGIADRIMVVHEGELNGCVLPADYNEEYIMRKTSGL